MAEYRVVHKAKGGPPVPGTFSGAKADGVFVGVFTPDGSDEGHDVKLTPAGLKAAKAEAVGR